MVILAAGKSTRMKSKRSKVLHPLCGRPVVSYVIAAAKKLKIDELYVVRSPLQNDLKEYLKTENVRSVVQKEPRGTADAVLAARGALNSLSVLILCGDTPLVRPETLRAFVNAVEEKNASVGFLTMNPADPTDYGRIVRDLDGQMIRIVEEKDASDEERRISEVNSGIIIARCDFLFRALSRIGSENAKGEFYITDIAGLAMKDGASVLAFNTSPPEDFLGINTRIDLAEAQKIMQARINRRHMLEGVSIVDPESAYIDADVKIGMDTTIFPGAFLLGKTEVGKNCTIESGVVLRDALVRDGAHIKAMSVVEESVVDKDASVGPFARIRPGSKVGKKSRVGNFVELKKCTLRDGAKANHLSYLGDALVGKRVNVGCGTITCNYDGFAKHRTIIGDGSFVGSDVQFVAPVRIGKGSVIGAGSTITRNVPADALAIARAEQVNVKGWAKKNRNS